VKFFVVPTFTYNCHLIMDQPELVVSSVVLKSTDTVELKTSEAVLAQQNHLHVDLCFVCADSQKIKLHKLVVGCANGFLAKLLVQGSSSYDEATIIFPDVDGDDLISVVSAIYTGFCHVPPNKVANLKDIVKMLGLPLVFEDLNSKQPPPELPLEEVGVADETVASTSDGKSVYEIEYVQIEELEERSEHLRVKPRSSLLRSNLPCLETTVVYRRSKESNKFDRADVDVVQHERKIEAPRKNVISASEQSSVAEVDGGGPSGYKLADFQCVHCEYKSLFKEELISHTKKEHLRTLRHKCDLCSKTFSRKNDLSRHLMLHSGERKYVCTFCDSKFIGSGDLHKHVRIHTGEKPYKCDFEECGKSFTQKGDLNKHVKIHLKIKDHKCFLCGYSCIQGSDLNNHMLTHSNSKPFPCELCFKSFRRVNQLSIHMKRFHTSYLIR